MSQPLVLTLLTDTASSKLLTSLRTHYFPPSLNHLSAHITLFHALPSTSQPQISALLTKKSSRESPFTIGIKNPFPLGNKGVGIHIASHKLRCLHEQLQWEFGREMQLSEQDERRIRPHVTVQNKVGAEEAKRTLEELRKTFVDTKGVAEGLALWRYEVGGEWTLLKEFRF